MAETVHRSRRILALHDALARGDDDALSLFRSECSRKGTPLVERIEGSAGELLVTFIWWGDEDCRSVLAVGGATGYDSTGNRMERIADTDLWYRSYTMPAGTSTTYGFVVNDSRDDGDWMGRLMASRPDPGNPRQFLVAADPEDPDDRDLLLSLVDLGHEEEDAPVEVLRTAPATGTCHQERVAGAVPGNDRRIWIYTPPEWRPGGERYPVLVVLDGLFYKQVIGLPALLDAAIGDGSIPPVVAVMVGNLNQAARTREFHCHAPFAEFLADELLPLLRGRYHLTTSAERTMVAGASYGGLAAAFAGYHRPKVFGGVLAQSGAFGWKPDDDARYCWLVRALASSPPLPVRFHLVVGVLETWLRAGDGPDRVSANRAMYAALAEKGAAVAYREFNGGHDYPCWRDMLIDGVKYLLGSD